MKQDNTVFLARSAALPVVEMRQARQSSACYHTHSHDEFSFGVIDSGIADYQNLDQCFRIGRGDTVLINPGELHSCNPLDHNWSYRMLFVDAKWVAQLQAEICDIKDCEFWPFTKALDRSSLGYQQFGRLFDSLLVESDTLLLETLLIQYLQQYCAIKQAVKIDPLKIRRVKEIISEQLNINHSLSDLSDESGLSRFHLIRCFKQQYGLSPHAYQLDLRIKRAKILLKSGCSLSEISHLLGFSDQSHLQRNFKKRLAITPKQYQAFFVK